MAGRYLLWGQTPAVSSQAGGEGLLGSGALLTPPCRGLGLLPTWEGGREVWGAVTGDIGKGSPWRGRGGRGGGGRPTVRCLYERAVRTTCQERQTEKETEDKRGSVSPTPAPRPHPPPGPALDVHATFSQGLHSAKLGHSLKPSDASHQPAPDTHMGTHSQPQSSSTSEYSPPCSGDPSP